MVSSGRHWSRISIVTLTLSIALTHAQISESQDFSAPQDAAKSLSWNIDGGYSLTNGDTARFLDDGWIFGLGLNWDPEPYDPTSPFVLNAQLNYSNYGATRDSVALARLSAPDVRIDDGSASVFGIMFNGVLRTPLRRGMRAYVEAGFGWDYRRVSFTQTVLVGGTYCDPWWGYCYSGVAPGQAIAADQATTRFAWNAGGGVEFALGNAKILFLQARYEEMDTRDNTTFIPIEIGLRF